MHVTAHVGYRGGVRAAIAVRSGLARIVCVVPAAGVGQDGMALWDSLLDSDLVVGIVLYAPVAREDCGGAGAAEDSVERYEYRDEVEALVEVGV